MKISLVHPHRVTRETLARILARKLNAEVVPFSNMENLLASSMAYDVFVLYNMFGRELMDRWEAVKWIRVQKPEALILSMIYCRFFDRKFAPPGSDATQLRVGDEIEGIVNAIEQCRKGKSYILISGHKGDERE
jgi:DNA-binding NarL/FixJ family response regulator